MKPAVGVCLEGDTTLRLMATADLYRAGRIYHVIVSGDVDEPHLDRFPAPVMRQKLIAMGLPKEAIDLEDEAQNTLDHALYVSPIAKERGFSELIIVTSGYHLLRAYRTFLKGVLNHDHPFSLYGHPAGSIRSWLVKSPTEGHYRFSLFFSELAKIRKYGDDVASPEETWQYIRSLKTR